jgi:acetyl esterase/lipase
MKRTIQVCIAILAIGTATAAPRSVERNVVFGMYSGLALLMDVYRPEKPNGAAILCIQGSGWSSPMAYDAAPITTRAEITMAAERLVAAGYTAFTINHRAAPRFHFPAQLEDAQRAVRFIRHHAADYGIDPARIGAFGTSSGGHLSQLLGTMAGAGHADDPDPVNRLSARVSAVVTLFAPSDLALQARTSSRTAHIVLMGFEYRDPQSGRLGAGRPGDFENQQYLAASPINHVSADDAPMLLFHGDQDDVVTIAQSEVMEAALKRAGVAVRFVRVPGGKHGGNFLFPAGDARAPDFVADALRWFGDHLK